MLITNRAQFEAMLARLTESPIICFDTETTWTEIHEDRMLLGVSVSVPRAGQTGTNSFSSRTTDSALTVDTLQERYDSWYLPVGHLPMAPGFDIFNAPMSWLQEMPWSDADKKWVAHNAMFDIEVMKSVGCDIAGTVFCTMVMYHMVNENLNSYGLDYLSNIMLGLRKIDETKKLRVQFEKNGLSWSHIPAGVMGSYAERDTELTLELFRGVYPRYKRLPSGFRANSIQFIRTLGKMVTGGLMVDADALAEHSARSGARMEALEALLGAKPTDVAVRRTLYGVGPLPHRPAQILGSRDKPWNLPVLEVTRAGAPAADKQTLTRLQAMYSSDSELVELLDLIMEYRTTQKAKSTWYDGWRDHLGPEGRIHPGFKQHGTETGRLSCSKPSTHQIPRDGDKYAVKQCILAPPGYAYVEFDYAALELREASALAAQHVGDRRMADIFLEGLDPHHITAELIGSYDYCAGNRKEGRQVGKRKNFLNIYGGGPERLRVALWGDARMDIPVEQCKEWQDKWHEYYWGFRAVGAKYRRVSYKNKYAETWNGRRRHFRYSELSDESFRDSFNFACQGGGGQCLMVAMNRMSVCQDFVSQMANTVHDSLGCYIPLDDYERQTEIVIYEMSRAAEEAFPGMKFPVEATELVRNPG